METCRLRAVPCHLQVVLQRLRAGETSCFLHPRSDRIKGEPEKPRPVMRGSTVVQTV